MAPAAATAALLLALLSAAVAAAPPAPSRGRGLLSAARAGQPAAAACRKREGFKGVTEGKLRGMPAEQALEQGFKARGAACDNSCDCQGTRLCKLDGWGRPRCWPALQPTWRKGKSAVVAGGSSVFSACVKNDDYKWAPATGGKPPGVAGGGEGRVCLSSCECDGKDLCTEDGWCLQAEVVVGQALGSVQLSVFLSSFTRNCANSGDPQRHDLISAQRDARMRSSRLSRCAGIARMLLDRHDLPAWACQAAPAASAHAHEIELRAAVDAVCSGSMGNGQPPNMGVPRRRPRLGCSSAGSAGSRSSPPDGLRTAVAAWTRPGVAAPPGLRPQRERGLSTSAAATAGAGAQGGGGDGGSGGGDGGDFPLPPGAELSQEEARGRAARLRVALGCEAAAAAALARAHPPLLLLGPYALSRLAAASHEAGFAGGHGGGAGGGAAAALLKEVVVDAPCTLQMRAMHWGMRLHISDLVSHCRALGLSVDSGKDFAVVWLGPRLQRRVVRRRAHRQQQGPQRPQQQQRQGQPEVVFEAAAPPRPRDARAPFVLVAYRHGAVALLGPPALGPGVGAGGDAGGADGDGGPEGGGEGGGEYEVPDADAAALSRVMPLGAFYRSGRQEGLRHAGPSLAQPAAADFHTLRIDPSAPAAARKEPNKLVLRVDAALTALHAAMADAPVTRGTGMFAGAQDSRLFKAAAYGSMAITEARSLLDAGELSWRFDAFAEAWALLFEDYCLETRFEALQLKLDEFKQTATFDLKSRHGRRYDKLTDKVILLLVISCAIALLELLLPPKAGERGGGAGHRRGAAPGGGADREWRWDERTEERRRWWQLWGPREPPGDAAAAAAGEGGAGFEAAGAAAGGEELGPAAADAAGGGGGGGLGPGPDEGGGSDELLMQDGGEALVDGPGAPGGRRRRGGEEVDGGGGGGGEGWARQWLRWAVSPWEGRQEERGGGGGGEGASPEVSGEVALEGAPLQERQWRRQDGGPSQEQHVRRRHRDGVYSGSLVLKSCSVYFSSSLRGSQRQRAFRSISPRRPLAVRTHGRDAMRRRSTVLARLAWALAVVATRAAAQGVCTDPTGTCAPQRASQLYGCGGERFNRANSRLMDWSFAGYMYGDYNPPNTPVMADVKATFGAKGDGVTDDTAAFELAISTIFRKGTLFVPRGTYVITRYAFGPGYINWNGGDFPDANTKLATVTAGAARGADIVRLIMDNVDNDMLGALNSRLMPPFEAYANRADVVRFTSKIVAVMDYPPRIKLERALPYQVVLTWRPEIHDWNNERYGVKRNETGMSDMTVRFPADAPFQGENREAGFNGLYMFHTGNSWIRNVVFENADLGIVMDGCSFNTISNVTFLSTRPRSDAHPYYGGKGIWLKGTFDNLVTDFRFATRFRYDLVVSYFATGNVFSSGSGVDLTMEFLYAAPYSNLFTNLHLGAATQPFGWVVRGQDASSFNTFWNLRTNSGTLQIPPYTWAPRATFVACAGATAPTSGTPTNWHVETTPVWPFDLWAAQRAARKRPLQPPAPVRHYGPGYGCFANNGTKCCTAATAGCPACPANAGTPSKLFGCQARRRGACAPAARAAGRRRGPTDCGTFAPAGARGAHTPRATLCSGELWDATGRLSYDWSYAGYKEGRSSIPWVPQVANIKATFGAKGDGVTDDTAAFERALESVTSGAILVPAGTYIITSVLNWRKPIVMRGEGRDATRIRFPKSMTDLYGNTWVEGRNVGTSQYSHGTGFLNIGGWDPTGRDFTRITPVNEAAKQGERVLKFSCCSNDMAVGQMVRLWMSDPGDGSLMSELHGGAVTEIADKLKGYPDPVRFLARITAKGANWIRLDRALPVKVDLAWKPEIHKFMPMIDGSAGVEFMTIQFPHTTYPGHFLEAGWNGIHLNQVSNGWVRGVRVENGDMGVYFWGTVFCTIENVDLVSTPRDRGWHNGHRGVWLEHGSDNVMKGFKISTRFLHDISVSGTEQGSVFMDGYGHDLNLDHHRSAPWSNLWTNLNAGLGTRVFEASGDLSWGTHTARFSTFHNLRSQLSFLLPPVNFGPQMTFIGLPTDDPTDPRDQDWWVEELERSYPPNLYNALRATRAARLPA
ncbi:MAG: hypothetical protein J3K34DRAFT_460951 [Monoraphidium minutum]|nr:MAG: hypothetical protein J3K34DRAFT_460951 [Monoraphidium minutum]